MAPSSHDKYPLIVERWSVFPTVVRQNFFFIIMATKIYLRSNHDQWYPQQSLNSYIAQKLPNLHIPGPKSRRQVCEKVKKAIDAARHNTHTSNRPGIHGYGSGAGSGGSGRGSSDGDQIFCFCFLQIFCKCYGMCYYPYISISENLFFVSNLS